MTSDVTLLHTESKETSIMHGNNHVHYVHEGSHKNYIENCKHCYIIFNGKHRLDQNPILQTYVG